MKEQMNFWDYEAAQTPLQAALRDWALAYQPNLFVTLTFRKDSLDERMRMGSYDLGSGVCFRKAEVIFGSFAHALKVQYLGFKSKKRLFMLPVIEGTNVEFGASQYVRHENTHIHLVARIPGNHVDAKDVIRRCWMAAFPLCGDPDIYCPDNDDWCQPLPTPEARQAATQYVLKSCRINTNTVLERFLPPSRFTSETHFQKQPISNDPIRQQRGLAPLD